ncbi:response regulator [Desulfosporosinus sp. BG]|uniref:response regulator n=1 Tax=Desulfosporosinus sp. BG TaxID=1633135 RepID=UPI00083B2860|nr:response regulator [Desulfosporosinus sp. BG]ODA39407.1 Sporulation initiation phosphotransferase (Spo0F) [Desulfosporosinus sp. BG]
MSNNHILVVDDNYGIRRLMYEFLTQEGYLVKEAAEGLRALQFVIEEKPKLVLLDMRMPGLGGVQVLAKLRDLAPETIVVIMSAYFDAKDLKEAVQDGKIKHFIIKPFDLVEVRILINDLMSNIEKHQNIIS